VTDFSMNELPDQADNCWVQQHCSRIYQRGVSLVCTERMNELYAMFDGKLRAYPNFGDPLLRPYGRGDAFMAGILFGMLHTDDTDRIVQLGLSAGISVGLIEEGLGSIDRDSFNKRCRSIMTSTD